MNKTHQSAPRKKAAPSPIDGRTQTYGKWERVTKRKDFLSASREAEKKIETREFLVLLKRNSRPQSRLGITVTKKIGNAVRRNRIKRQVREQFRINKSHLPKGFDIVFIARKGIVGNEGQGVSKAIRKVADRKKI